MSFNGKVVIVTGASSGIGGGVAIKFAELQANVVLVGRNKEKLNEVAGTCEKHGAKALPIIADISRKSDIQKIIANTLEQFGRIDVLANCAGIPGKAAIWEEHAMEAYDRVMAVNLRSVVYLTHLASRHLIESKGNIVNISSIASLEIMTTEHFTYCASKAGLDHFSKSIARDFATKGVRVNCINPGPVRTDIARKFGVPKDGEDEFWQKMADITALGRVANPEDIAELAVFLASDKAKAITGSLYVVDNGALLKRA